MRAIAIVFATLCVPLTVSASAAPVSKISMALSKADTPVGDAPDIETIRALVHQQTNAMRAQTQQKALPVATPLLTAAQGHAERMIAANFVGHIDKGQAKLRTATDRVRAQGVKNPYIAENVAGVWIERKQTHRQAAAALLAAWEKSPPHKASILSDKAVQVGIGIAFRRDEHYTLLVGVQNFQWYQAVNTTPDKPQSEVPTPILPNDKPKLENPADVIPDVTPPADTTAPPVTDTPPVAASKQMLSAQIDLATLNRLVAHYSNLERQKAGLQPLPNDRRLVGAAAEYASRLLHGNFFSHYDNGRPKLRTATQRVAHRGIINPHIAENIAGNWAQGRDTHAILAQKIVKQWMNSPGHRANILSDKAVAIGCGVALRQENGMFKVMAVQNFQWFEPAKPALR